MLHYVNSLPSEFVFRRFFGKKCIFFRKNFALMIRRLIFSSKIWFFDEGEIFRWNKFFLFFDKKESTKDFFFFFFWQSKSKEKFFRRKNFPLLPVINWLINMIARILIFATINIVATQGPLWLRPPQWRRAALPGAGLHVRGHPARHQRLWRPVVAGQEGQPRRHRRG